MINPDEIKTLGDGVAVAGTAGALVEMLPAISAALTSIWFIIRIYQEIKTLRSDNE